MKNDKEIIKNLIEILFDPNAREDEVDDAALDLGDYDDDCALNALVKAATESYAYNWTVLQNIGESIFDIWDKRNYFSKETFNQLNRSARIGLYQRIKSSRPEWINEYQIALDSDETNNEPENISELDLKVLKKLRKKWNKES